MTINTEKQCIFFHPTLHCLSTCATAVTLGAGVPWLIKLGAGAPMDMSEEGWADGFVSV